MNKVENYKVILKSVNHLQQMLKGNSIDMQTHNH